jgi:3-deoxy-7-phosphoheptulonate synthase
MAAAAVAAGADGLIIEVHPRPEVALSDGYQSLTFDQFNTTMQICAKVAHALGRHLGSLCLPKAELAEAVY